MEFFNSFNKKNGILVVDHTKCTYCGICQKKCPHKAIKVDIKNKRWKLRLICMKCGRCVKECPENAISIEK